jgi:hypothetical protein
MTADYEQSQISAQYFEVGKVNCSNSIMDFLAEMEQVYCAFK